MKLTSLLSPLAMETVRDLVAPTSGLQVTSYVPGFSWILIEPPLPLALPFTKKRHGDPVETATSEPGSDA